MHLPAPQVICSVEQAGGQVVDAGTQQGRLVVDEGEGQLWVAGAQIRDQGVELRLQGGQLRGGGELEQDADGPIEELGEHGPGWFYASSATLRSGADRQRNGGKMTRSDAARITELLVDHFLRSGKN